MNRPKNLGLAIALLMIVYGGLVSCSDPEATATGDADQVAKMESSQSTDVDKQVSTAREDLAARLDVDIGEIEIETVRHVHWRSGAGGCPRPGMSYTMAIVPGLLIVLRGNGEVHQYHAAGNRPASYCPAERAEAPVMGQGEEAM